MTITLTREEAQQVLDAFAWELGGEPLGTEIQKAVELLRARLAQPDETLMKRVMDGIPDMPIKVQDDSESPPESWAQSAQVNGIDRWIKANIEHRQWYICPKCSYQAPRFKDEWQGLTKDEINNWDLPNSPTVYEFAQFVEAKLKEKNT